MDILLNAKERYTMKVRDIMTNTVIKIHPEETVEVAARALAHYNVGVLPVCEDNGAVCGVVTDRDLVTRCIASNRSPSDTKVRQIMTGQVLSAKPDMDVGVAAHLMGREQIRRLPVPWYQPHDAPGRPQRHSH